MQRIRPDQMFAAYLPRPGQPITFDGNLIGHVSRVEGSLCWYTKPDGDPSVFIWCFHDGLNNRCAWPTRSNERLCA